MPRDRRVRYVLPIEKRPAYCGPLVLHSDVCTVDRLSVLDRLQNTDITKMHGKRLQWVLSRITKSARFPGRRLPLLPSSKYWYAALMVTARRASRTGTRSCGPQHRPLLCNAVHCAPYSLQHVRLDNGRILMERITEALCARRGRGADARRAFRSEILEMHVAPMVYMSHKKRRYHPVLCRPGQLVLAPSICAWMITGRIARQGLPDAARALRRSPYTRRYCSQAASPLQCTSNCIFSSSARSTYPASSSLLIRG